MPANNQDQDTRRQIGIQRLGLEGHSPWAPLLGCDRRKVLERFDIKTETALLVTWKCVTTTVCIFA